MDHGHEPHAHTEAHTHGDAHGATPHVTPFDPERVTLFARTDARGRNVPFGIKAKDRTRHVYVIGKTGMGKSTMLENMAVQDIQNGEGMAFMDPHGASAEKILEYIPEHRIKDVLYFAPFDMAHPMSFNVMEDVGYDKRHLVVSGLMSTFKKIWVDAWSARMEYILSNTMLALLEYPDATLLGVNRMLSDKDYRELVVNNVKDPSVRSFWVDEFAKYNERYMQEAGDAIKNKIGQFTANPLIRNIVGQPKSSFDVRKMMDERKILIINLSKGLVGETNANLLGSMFITRIYLSAMSRADMSPTDMAKAPNFYLYVDEFQSFANETFANILSEARKYKLNLTIAHQYVEQMEEEVRNAVFGNVGTTIAFRVGPFDAEVLETVFSPQFLATDLVNLGFAQIYLTLMIDGIGSRPFSATTLPPIPIASVSHVDRVIAASRATYAKPRDEVEEYIRVWHEPIKKPPRPGLVGDEKNRSLTQRTNEFKRPVPEGKPAFTRAVPLRPPLASPSVTREPLHARPPLREQKETMGAQGVMHAPGAVSGQNPELRSEFKPEQKPEPRSELKHESKREVVAKEQAVPAYTSATQVQPARHVRTPEAQQRASAHTPSQAPKQLDDLRAVLQKLSQKNGAGGEKKDDEQRATKDPAPKNTEKKDDTHALKHALASVMEKIKEHTPPPPQEGVQKTVDANASMYENDTKREEVDTKSAHGGQRIEEEKVGVGVSGHGVMAQDERKHVSVPKIQPEDPRSHHEARREMTREELEKMLQVSKYDRPPV